MSIVYLIIILRLSAAVVAGVCGLEMVDAANEGDLINTVRFGFFMLLSFQAASS